MLFEGLRKAFIQPRPVDFGSLQAALEAWHDRAGCGGQPSFGSSSRVWRPEGMRRVQKRLFWSSGEVVRKGLLSERQLGLPSFRLKA